MTVLEWKLRDGGAAGRCDGTCHNAHDRHCDCFCGGHLHGVNQRPGGMNELDPDRWRRALENARLKARLVRAELLVNAPPLQLPLFGAPR